MNSERIAERIALLLLKVDCPVSQEASGPDWQAISAVSNEAVDMAVRVKRGWMTLAGKPYYTSRLQKLDKEWKRK